MRAPLTVASRRRSFHEAGANASVSVARRIAAKVAMGAALLLAATFAFAAPSFDTAKLRPGFQVQVWRAGDVSAQLGNLGNCAASVKSAFQLGPHVAPFAVRFGA